MTSALSTTTQTATSTLSTTTQTTTSSSSTTTQTTVSTSSTSPLPPFTSSGKMIQNCRIYKSELVSVMINMNQKYKIR